MGFPTKVWFVMLLTVALTVGASSVLSYFKFEAKLREIVVSRLTITADELHKKIQRALTLGLLLSELDELQAVVDREVARDGQIRGIDIFDESGTVVFSSTPGRVGASVAASSEAYATMAAGAVQKVLKGEVLAITLPFRNGFDQYLGGLSIRYSMTGIFLKERRMIERIALGAGITLVVFGLFAFVGCMLFMGGIDRRARRTRLALERIFRPVPAGEAPGQVPDALVEGLRRNEFPAIEPDDEVARDAARLVAALRGLVEDLRRVEGTAPSVPAGPQLRVGRS